MDKNLKIVLLIAAALAVILFVVWCSIYFSKGNRKGRAAERKVAKRIRKLGKKDNVRLMNNVYLQLYNGTCEIDHLVFGRFGVFIVETKGISGSVSGDGKRLVHKIGTKTHKLYNPQLQNRTHIDNVVHHLRKGGFGDVPVTGVVVFTDKDLVLNTNVGIKLDQLDDVYNSLSDAGCNQDVLYHYFQKIQVTNPIKRFLHKFSYDE